MNKKMLALYGLKWNPFAPDVPVEALASAGASSRSAGASSSFGEGCSHSSPARTTGKSVPDLERLDGQRDVKIGIVSRPQAGLADFYREMGDLFGVELAPHKPVPRCCAIAGRPRPRDPC